MPTHRGAHCVRCHRHRDDCGQLSYNGLCGECGIGTAAETMRQMAAKSGPKYEAWRRSQIELGKRLEAEITG